MKIAISGTHGTGKSTAVMALARQTKIERPGVEVGVLMEVARACPGNLNRAASSDSQLWIFAEQVRREIEMMRPLGAYDCLITDRSVMDSVAYAKALSLPIWRAMFSMACTRVTTYDRIIFHRIDAHDHWHDDGVRECTDPEFRRLIEQELLGLYSDAGTELEFL